MNSTIFVNMNSTIFSNMNSTLDDISSILVQFQILFFSKRFRFLDYYFCQIPKWLNFLCQRIQGAPGVWVQPELLFFGAVTGIKYFVITPQQSTDNLRCFTCASLKKQDRFWLQMTKESNEKGSLEVRPCVNEHWECVPETSLQARDNPFGREVLETPGVEPTKLFSPGVHIGEPLGS